MPDADASYVTVRVVFAVTVSRTAVSAVVGAVAVTGLQLPAVDHAPPVVGDVHV